MIRLLAWLAGTLLLLVLAAGGLLLAAVDRQPLVSRSETIAPLAVAQARWLFQTNDPRRLRPGEARQTAIPVALIDEGINYAASRGLRGRGGLLLNGDAAEIRLSLRLPGEHYLNLRASIPPGPGEPRLASAALGTLPLPAGLLELALNTAIEGTGYGREWRLARSAIRNLNYDTRNQRILVSYVWEPAILERARAIALNPAELDRIRSAQRQFAALLDHHARGAKVALPDVLQAMLAGTGDDQRQQRRAALLVMAAYLAEKDLAAIIPDARNWPQPRQVMLMLAGRYDSAQHFVISAALAAWAGEPVADAIGVYKELADSRHGSGFSFADLAADRAGTRFGEGLNRDDAKLQAALQSTLREQDLIPSLAGLPEYISARDFRRQFGDPSSPAYQRLNAEIEQRLAALPLYRP